MIETSRMPQATLAQRSGGIATKNCSKMSGLMKRYRLVARVSRFEPPPAKDDCSQRLGRTGVQTAVAAADALCAQREFGTIWLANPGPGNPPKCVRIMTIFVLPEILPIHNCLFYSVFFCNPLHGGMRALPGAWRCGRRVSCRLALLLFNTVRKRCDTATKVLAHRRGLAQS